MNERTGRQPEDVEQMSFGEKIRRIAGEIGRLDPGPAAALRRGTDGGGTAVLWRLLTNYGVRTRRTTEWVTAVQAIAILTPKGEARRSAHEGTTSMGAALYANGISDDRLSRLFASRGKRRHTAAIRLCRRLAATDAGPFNMTTLARFIFEMDEETDYEIARNFYEAERAARKNATKEKD